MPSSTRWSSKTLGQMHERRAASGRPFVLVPVHSGYEALMTEHERQELTPEELDEARGELLPDREEMTMLPIEPTHGSSLITLPVEPPATE